LQPNAIKPVPPTLGGALRRDQGQIIDFEIKKIGISPATRGGGRLVKLSVISYHLFREWSGGGVGAVGGGAGSSTRRELPRLKGPYGTKSAPLPKLHTTLQNQ
jgi:hypothetical protein